MISAICANASRRKSPPNTPATKVAYISDDGAAFSSSAFGSDSNITTVNEGGINAYQLLAKRTRSHRQRHLRLPEADRPHIKKYRLSKAGSPYVQAAQGRSSPNVNQQVVTGHPAALFSCRLHSRSASAACGLRHRPLRMFALHDTRYPCVQPLQMWSAARWPNSSEMNFVNFVVVRVKAPPEWSHAAHRLKFNTQFSPAPRWAFAARLFRKPLFKHQRNQQRLRANRTLTRCSCA